MNFRGVVHNKFNDKDYNICKKCFAAILELGILVSSNKVMMYKIGKFGLQISNQVTRMNKCTN